jgi:tetratricopeptide (TPR) repeat protein
MCYLPTVNFAQDNIANYENIGQQLYEVIELTDLEIALDKIADIEEKVKKDPSHFNRLKLGILYYEAAMLSPRTNKETLKLIEKSYMLLSVLKIDGNTDLALMPYVTSYHASSLAILGYYQESSKLVNQAFYYFEEAITLYGENSCTPHYMRAKIAKYLPIYYSKRNVVKKDLEIIIDRFGLNHAYATNKAMSYVYYSWANLYHTNKNRTQTVNYLKKSIDLDPNNIAAGKDAKKILEKFNPSENKLTAAR